MEKKLMSFKTKGMNQDLSVSAFNPEFSFENHNLRLSTNEGNTLMSWVNEKGTLELKIVTGDWEKKGDSLATVTSIKGTPVGTCVIDNNLVIFTHDGSTDAYPDYIYVLRYNNEQKTELKGRKLFNGNLNFQLDHPLETLAHYESTTIMKVYWIDGVNQPRLINICTDPNNYLRKGIGDSLVPINTYFDFIRELELKEEVIVTKLDRGAGSFPAGVIQYAFTYYTKYGQESNIFYTTPLYYISHYDRAGSPEETIANSFRIQINNVDTRFDYIRVYSIIRTSLDSIPQVKRIQDLEIHKEVVISEYIVPSVQTFSRSTQGFAISTDEDSYFTSIEDFESKLSEDEIKAFRYNLPNRETAFTEESGFDLPKAAEHLFDEEWAKSTIEEVIDRDFSGDNEEAEIELTYDYYDNQDNDDNGPTAILKGIQVKNRDFFMAYDLKIPETTVYNGKTYTVTGIAASAFPETWWTSGHCDVDQLFVPKTITYIEPGTFTNTKIRKACYIYLDLEEEVIKSIDVSTVFGLSKDNVPYIHIVVPNEKLKFYKQANWPALFINGEEHTSQESAILASLDDEDHFVEWDARFVRNAKYYYKFKQSDYPNLKLLTYGELIYTWPSDVDNAVIYLFPSYTKLKNDTLVNTDSLGLIICEKLSGPERWEPCNLLKRESSENKTISAIYVDTNTEGESEDPTKLLYLGGEEITASSLCQKDGTLFLGNISIKRESPRELKEDIENNSGITHASPLITKNIECARTRRAYNLNAKGTLSHINTLTCPEKVVDNQGNIVPYQGVSCFKTNEYYRLGIQFQYKTGKWSDPIWIGDKQWVRGINDITPASDESGNNYNFNTKNIGVHAVPEFLYTLSAEIVKKAYNLGYKRVRAVYAQSEQHDRTILCQGILNPTMYRRKDRNSGSCYAQSSWLFRSLTRANKYTGYRDTNGEGGAVSYCGYPFSLYMQPMTAGNGNTGEELLLSGEYATQDPDEITNNHSYYSKVWMPYYRSTEIMGYFDEDDKYRIDNNLITMHSPDIELSNIDSSNTIKNSLLYSIGFAHLERTLGDIEIQTSTPTIGNSGAGFMHRSLNTVGTSALISGNYYEDHLVYCEELSDSNKSPIYTSLKDGDNHDTDRGPVYWPVYMWHRKGSLNNDVTRDNQSAKLLKKIISNYRKCDQSYILQNVNKEVNDIQVFNKSEASQIIKISGNIYQGCVDTLLVPSYASSFYFVGEPLENKVEGLIVPKFTDTPICKTHQHDITDIYQNNWVYAVKSKITGNDDASYNYPLNTFNSAHWVSMGNDYDDLGTKVSGLGFFKEGIPIKFKSSPHIVIQLAKSDRDNLLCFWSVNGPISNDKHPEGALPLAELRVPYDPAIIFGGTSDEALRRAKWIPCGPVINIKDTKVKIPFKWGDTYYQRFESLKTYSYTPEDINQVIEIASFYVESRINLDGRYDRNRGNASNLYISPQNFNLINPVYSQIDNFFTYRILPDDYYDNRVYPNQLTWTKNKNNGEDVDSWANITLASVIDMDGNCGKINKITKLNNQLFVFQDSGLSQILYNESMQMSTEQGMPIELGNSGKVTGNRYISNSIGCTNKHSIVTTGNGLYFIDSLSKDIYLFTDRLNNISTKYGLNTWCKTNIPSPEILWDSINFDNIKTHYDKLGQDVYFSTSKTSLVFSEKLSCFTSFYDYGKIPYFNNIGDTGIWLKPNSNETTTIWKHQAGEYCNFFGKEKPYGMILVGNPEPQADKMFTNLEFRAYADEDDITPFDSLTTWNEYQEGSYTFTNNMKNASFLSKKFRMWRCNIPRDRKHIMDRMRGPWLYLKLEKNTDTSSRVEIHDIAMTYYK